jgi:hypothetical protein
MGSLGDLANKAPRADSSRPLASDSAAALLSTPSICESFSTAVTVTLLDGPLALQLLLVTVSGILNQTGWLVKQQEPGQVQPLCLAAHLQGAAAHSRH